MRQKDRIKTASASKFSTKEIDSTDLEKKNNLKEVFKNKDYKNANKTKTQPSVLTNSPQIKRPYVSRKSMLVPKSDQNRQSVKADENVQFQPIKEVKRENGEKKGSSLVKNVKILKELEDNTKSDSELFGMNDLITRNTDNIRQQSKNN